MGCRHFVHQHGQHLRCSTLAGNCPLSQKKKLTVSSLWRKYKILINQLVEGLNADLSELKAEGVLRCDVSAPAAIPLATGFLAYPAPQHAPASASFRWGPACQRVPRLRGGQPPGCGSSRPAPAVKTVAANRIAQEACPRHSCYAPTGRVHRISARVRLTPWARQPPQG